MKSQETVLVLSNSNWNIANFRRSFISFLQGDYKVCVGSFQGQERIDIEGVNFVELPNIKRNSVSIKNAWLYILGLIKIVRTNEISRIYVFTFYLSSLCALLKMLPIGKKIHIRAIITGLGKLYTSNNVLLNVLFYCCIFLLRKADSIVVQNNSDFQLLSRYIASNKLNLIPGSGVSLFNTCLEPTPKEKTKPMVFCYVGRLLKSKGVDIIIDAFRMYLQCYPNDKLLIFGDYDSNDRRFRLEINEKNIEIKGWSNNVNEVFAKSHATLLMSDREGMPKTLLESLANSTPIIAFAAPGVEDIYMYASSSDVGVVVEERNAEALMRALQEYRKLDVETYIQMGVNGRNLAYRVFSDQIINKELK